MRSIFYNKKITDLKNYLFLLLVFVVVNVSAQNIDSLKTALKIAKHDTVRCSILSSLIQLEPDEEVWPEYNNQLKSIAEKNLKTEMKDDKLRKFYLRHLANALNDQAYIVTNLGDIQQALECYRQSLKINQSLNNRVGMSVSFSDLGTIYYNQAEYDKAMEYFEKSLEIQKEIGDELGEANSYNNIGLTYKTKGDVEKALIYYNKSLVLHKKVGNRPSEAITMSNIGNIYLIMNDESKALSNFVSALAIQEEVNDKSGVSATLTNLANLMIKQGNYNSALEYANRGLLLAQEIGYPENVAGNAFLLKKIYRAQHNIPKELEMFELYILMRDSVNNENNRKSSIRSQYQYEYEKMAAADSVKVAEEKKITVAQLKQERTQRFALYGGLALVALFAAFMYNRVKVTQRQKNIISQQKEEVELQRHAAEHQKELVQEKQKEIIDSITYAKRLQTAILPPQDYINKFLPDNFVFYQPKDIVAGDFYWMETVSSNKKAESSLQGSDVLPTGNCTLIAACDSTGHGVPGAMVSIVCSNALDKAVKEFGLTDTGKILDKTRDLVLETFSKSGEEIKDGMDISLLSIVQTKNSTLKTIKWSGANNQLWYITRIDGMPVLMEVKGDKQPIGNSDNRKLFTTHEIPYEEGMLVYLMTDGYSDQFGGVKGKKFKYKQLKEILITNCHLDLKQQKEIIDLQFHNWKGNLDQVDDVTVIGLKL